MVWPEGGQGVRLGTFFMPPSPPGAHSSHFYSPLFFLFLSRPVGCAAERCLGCTSEPTERPRCQPRSEVIHIPLAPTAQSDKFPPKEHPAAPFSQLVHVHERRALAGALAGSRPSTKAPQAQRHTRARLGHMALMDTQHWALGLDAGRAVAEQPVGERHWALGRWRICRSRPRKTTPLHWLEASIDAVVLCIVATAARVVSLRP